MRTTHTFAELEVSEQAYLEIYTLLSEAGYHHAFINGAIDMKGIALTRKDNNLNLEQAAQQIPTPNSEPARPPKTERRLLVSRRQLVASLAYCGISQSPYTLPDDFMSVLLQFDLSLSKRWTTDEPCLGFMDFTRDSLADLLRSTLMAIPQFVDWNLSAAEKAAGVKVDDDRRTPFIFTSRFREPKTQCDFIDLDALIRNICNLVESDQVD
jgi:hypothetical protein